MELKKMGAKEQISPLELLLKDSHIVDWWLGLNTFLIKVHRARTLLWDPHGDSELFPHRVQGDAAKRGLFSPKWMIFWKISEQPLT